MISNFIFSMCATLGCSVLFHVPAKHIPAASAAGGLGWVVYYLLEQAYDSTVFPCFIASCAIGLICDIFSRFFKEASTVFIIPAIIPLVPGSGMYYTMLAVVSGNLSKAADEGIKTLFLAGAIALGLLVTASSINIFVSEYRKHFKKTTPLN